MVDRTTDETKRFVELLCEKIKEGREQINYRLSSLSEYPGETAAHSFEICTTLIQLKWRSVLLKYLTGSLTREELETRVNDALHKTAKQYREETKQRRRSLAEFAVLEFTIDYLLNAKASEYSHNWDYDLILENADRYPVLDSVLEVFPIDEPTTFPDLNTKETEVK